MPDRKLGLVVWRNALTDPPDGAYVPCWTDVGPATWLRDRGEWRHPNLEPMTATPSVWCDPRPPGDDALTSDHLQDILDICVWHVADLQRRGIHYAESAVKADDLAARLRRAIEEAER